MNVHIRVTLRNGVFASAGRRLVALAKDNPPLMLDLESFPQTFNR